MPELVHLDMRTPLGSTNPNIPRNARGKIGQNRATKRGMADYKRSNRSRRSSKPELNKSKCLMSDSELHREKNRIDIPINLQESSLSPTDETTFHGQSPNANDYKRPRPELPQILSDKVFMNISSSAPCRLREGSNHMVFGGHSPDSTATRLRNFVCDSACVNEDKLRLLLSKELYYHPNNAFLYYVNPDTEDKVDATLRNEAVHDLRFMHTAFFNLSCEVFCKAVNLIDRFIVKVKVKPKYMACVATASYCAVSKLCHQKNDVELPEPEVLVNITRCGGNAADLQRMEEILSSKLCDDLVGVNTFDFLNLFIDSLHETTHQRVDYDLSIMNNCPTEHHDKSFSANVKPPQPQCGSTDDQQSDTCDDDDGPEVPADLAARRMHMVKRLMNRLEIALCSLGVYRFRPACLTLGIMVQSGINGLLPLATKCGVEWDDVLNCAAMVNDLYKLYFRDQSVSSKRPLVWTLSRRTLFRIGYSSPTPLDTIKEDYEPTEEDEWLLPLLFEP